MVALVLIMIAVVAFSLASKGRGKQGSFVKKRLATPHEQAMYWRLIDALPQPEYIVLAQVSFGALLNAKQGASRYSFSQKIADFVVTDKSFSVLAVIELDDSSHRGKESRDIQRDAMLVEAGYKVLRYSRIPDLARLRSDLVPAVPAHLDMPPMTAER
ncbi:MAG: DUF2726 domain-containing protein [Curvibacter sp.]